ncbi:hypothetical protein L7F22_039765 [Adiantum nelumboides]|nr:hypothetical protein [Adiantum nelumboides]
MFLFSFRDSLLCLLLGLLFVGTGPSTRIAAARFILPTVEQARWDVKDTQAHALIALSVKHTITPHICSAKSAEQAWDILAGLYAGRNEAKIALLRKELESKIMNEEDDMDTFLASIKTVLDALPDSYQTFASTWQLMNQRNPEVVKFDEVCTLLLQEALSRKNRSRQRAVEQAFIAAKRRGGNSNAATSHGSSASGKSPVPNASSASSLSGILAKEAKKKEGDSPANAGSTINAFIVVSSVKENSDADAEWAFSAKCTYNPVVHDACMAVAANSHVWYFDSGATKHITSHRDLFTSLESVHHGNSVTCANNASYPVQGVGKIVLTAANGSSFTLIDALYEPGIKKNLLSVFTLARLGLVVKFVDDRCTVHDLSFGDEIVASGILCRGLYKLTLYDKLTSFMTGLNGSLFYSH